MSLKTSETSRRNGARSKGPVTAAGRARSSQNAIRHGIHARPAVLRSENPAAWDALELEYVEYFRPFGPAERKLVDELVVCEWRQRRIWSTETAAIDLEMDTSAQKIAAHFESIDLPTRTALAYKTSDLDSMNRYEARYHHQYRRSLQQLLELQDRRNRENAKLQNEPENPQTPIPCAA